MASLFVIMSHTAEVVACGKMEKKEGVRGGLVRARQERKTSGCEVHLVGQVVAEDEWGGDDAPRAKVRPALLVGVHVADFQHVRICGGG